MLRAMKLARLSKTSLEKEEKSGVEKREEVRSDLWISCGLKGNKKKKS